MNLRFHGRKKIRKGKLECPRDDDQAAAHFCLPNCLMCAKIDKGIFRQSPKSLMTSGSLKIMLRRKVKRKSSDC